MRKLGILATIALALAACSSDDTQSVVDPSYSSDTETNGSSSSVEPLCSGSITSSNSSADSLSSSSVTSSSAKVPTSDGSVITLGEVIDSRDGNVYKTTVIGNQVWMAENLRFDVQEYLEKGPYQLADTIEDYESGAIYTTLLYFYQESDDMYSKEITNYYYWKMAIDSAGIFSTDASECAKTGDCTKQGHIRGICPEGFHVPDSMEVEQLYRAVGGKCLAAKDLRAESNVWRSLISMIYELEPATDKYGFSATPDGCFVSAWWDAYEAPVVSHSAEKPVIFLTNKRGQTWGFNDQDEQGYTDGVFHSFIHNDGNHLYTMRCLRDEPAGVDWVDPPEPQAPVTPEFEYGEFTDERDGKTYQTVVVNGKTWMNQNLAYLLEDESGFTCEHPLIGVKVDCEKEFYIDSSYCNGSMAKACKNYGRFYTWEQAKKACPAGFHLPDTDEMNDFVYSPNPYTVYYGECYARDLDFSKQYDLAIHNHLMHDLLGNMSEFEFWSSTQDPKHENHVFTSNYRGLTKNYVAHVRCIKD